MNAPSWRRYLTFWRPNVRRDVDDEVRFHLEERTADLVSSGLTPADAARQARAEFGDVDQVSAGLRDIDQRILDHRARTEWRTVMLGEITHALRRLIRQPAFTGPAILTLALGIGATTAIFTVLNAVLLQPLPYANAERLVYLDTPMPGMGADTRWWLARHEMFHFKQNSRILENIGVYQIDGAILVGDASNASELIPTANVSATLLDVLGFKPHLGRLLTQDDNRFPDPRVVILGYELWSRRYGADRNIVGKTIPVGPLMLQVVGVMQPGAELPRDRVDAWMPAWVDPTMEARNNHTWTGIGRLKRGFTAADLERELRPMVARFPEVFPRVYTADGLKKSGFSVAAQPLHDWVVGSVVTRALWILLASVVLVFLVAAANVANLFLVRVDARRREMAMRVALGASRSHLAAHFFAEGLVLSIAASALGVVLAVVGLNALLVGAPEGIPRLGEVHLRWQGIVVAVALALATGSLFAIMPIGTARADMNTLREGSRTLTLSKRRHAVRGALVAGQVALALVLLTAAGLMVKSFRNLKSVDGGFNGDNTLTVDVALPATRYPNDVAVASFFQDLSSRLSAVSDVDRVGFGEAVPPDMSTGCTGVLTESETREQMKSACVMTLRVSPGYFEALGMRVRGRTPTWTETNAGAGPAIITRSLAEKFWPGEDPVGKGIRCCQRGPLWYRIVGVADDIRGNGFDQPVTQTVFFPMIAPKEAPLEGTPWGMQVIVRSRSGNLLALAPVVRNVIAGMDVQIPIGKEQSMEQIVAKSMAKRTFTLTLLGIASAMALLLSAIGLYGVVSYTVGERRGEIGVRVALGARTAVVGRMIVMQSVNLAAVGVAIGLVGAVATTRVMRSLLFGVQPTDPVTLLLVSATLVFLAAAASWVPARRAMRVDPVEALRG
jgi:predicted permease